MSDVYREKTISEMIEYHKNLNSTVKGQRKTLQASLKNAETKLSNLYSLIENGTLDEFDAQRISSVKTEIRELRNSLQSLPNTASIEQLNPAKLNALFAKMYEKLKEQVREGNIEVMQMIINSFIEKVVICGDKVEATIKITPGDFVSAGTVEPHLHQMLCSRTF